MSTSVNEEVFNIAGAEFTRTEIIRYIQKTGNLLADLSTINDYELPYRVPPLIDRAIEIRREFAK